MPRRYFTMQKLKHFDAMRVLAFVMVAIVAYSVPAKSRFAPNDTLTDFNVAPADGPEDVAILRVMQKTHDPSGKPLRRKPGIRIFSLGRVGDPGRRPPLKSQHVRLKPGEYIIIYACGLGSSQLESNTTHSFAAGRRYYIYCESRNFNHYELKITEVP
jgi:hypothetical protein